METLSSSSALVPKFSDTLPPIYNTNHRTSGFLKTGPKTTTSYLCVSHHHHYYHRFVIVSAAVAKQVSDEGEEEDKDGIFFNNNGFNLVNHRGNSQSDEISENGAIGTPKIEAHFPGKILDYDENGEKNIHNMEKPSVVTYSSLTGGGGTRAGLFRTPISGGVQSATSAHGLPRPALAVRNLMEQARFAHLCTVMSQMHHRREGYPFGSLVDFATDSMGHPIFSFSPLAIHTRNLLKDPRCSLVVQIPGWSGLSNARVTIVGDVFPLSENQQEWAHKQYMAKHQQGPSQQWGNFYYFRMQNTTYASRY